MNNVARTSNPSNDLVARLRERLITVPKPGSKPFEWVYPISHTIIPGEKHKPGDSAGVNMVNVNITVASSVPSKFMAQEFIYAPSPLDWEAAAELERLRAALERISGYALHQPPVGLTAEHLQTCPSSGLRCVSFLHSRNMEPRPK